VAQTTPLLDARQMRRVLRRMAGEIIERNRDLRELVLVGIRTRGVPMAELFAAEIERLEGVAVPTGHLDITMYRDDLSPARTRARPQPVVKETWLPEAIDDKVVVLCDDVLFTGRTIRAALDALMDYGRPRAVQLVTLIDRGHRELPIQADVVGRKVTTRPEEQVKVSFEQLDGENKVEIVDADESPALSPGGAGDGE
jgi:pyrimidine operon attenuation protein/uracil phosphoribosyltransferase